MSRDVDKSIACAVSIAPAAKAASVNGTGVDLAGFDAAVCIFYFGVATDGTHTPTLEDSDDNSSFATVVAPNLSGAFTAVTSGAGGSAIQEVGYLGQKRYLRAVSTVSGATTGALTAAMIIKANPRTLPQ